MMASKRKRPSRTAAIGQDPEAQDEMPYQVAQDIRFCEAMLRAGYQFAGLNKEQDDRS